ncbi:MAG: glutamine synthetase family protein [bacterium]|nr:glutamine synthetase family protein [bacterium]
MNFLAQNFSKRDVYKEDILDYIENNKIKILNFCYTGSDSKFKQLSFPATDMSYIDSVLSLGERTAGVFPGAKEESADLYIIPRYRDAFPDPFTAIPALNILCSFFDKDGNALDIMPENILKNAVSRFEKETGLTLKAAGELEYFVIYPNTYDLFNTHKKHYHDSSPFAVWEDMRNEILDTLAFFKIPVKYAHTESGKIKYNDNFSAEQHEIEFLPVPICEAAENVVISKWVVCSIAKKYGVSTTFAPVAKYGETGTGLHFHLELLQGKKNIVFDANGQLSTESQKMIGGMLKFAPSLTAFGNPIPISYLRFMSKKDAPSAICWGERNRKALVRIPLGWQNTENKMMSIANPGSENIFLPDASPTIEFRPADGTAAVQLLLAGLVVAIENGLKDNSILDITKKLYVAERETLKEGLEILPLSCEESAEALKKDRAYYEKDRIFPPELIDNVIKDLLAFKEEDAIIHNPEENKEKIPQLVEKYLHY